MFDFCSSASAFFSGLVRFYTDPLHNQPSLESAMLHVPVLATICRCSTNFIVFLYKVWQNCTHYVYIYIYIHIYIQTLSQNRTAIIKISCLTTLSNKYDLWPLSVPLPPHAGCTRKLRCSQEKYWTDSRHRVTVLDVVSVCCYKHF